ncbi:MAG: diguanylate cyclase [Gammaproteobacteria bacterium]|nr:diguanylate cyclase [Gammaproteobacteria bacterium]
MIKVSMRIQPLLQVKLIISAILLICFTGFTLAYEFKYQKHMIGVESGLPQSTVRAILQDPHGLMYFATDDGVSQFNGFTHRRLQAKLGKERNLFSFSDLCYWQGHIIAPSFDGGFLVHAIATEASQEFYLSNLFSPRAGTQVIGCVSDEKSTKVWMITDRGLFSIQPSVSESITVLDAHWLAEEGYPEHSINAIEKHRNLLYIATNKGMLLFDFGQLVTLPLPNVSQQSIKAMAFESNEWLWVLLEDRVARFRMQDLSWRESNSPLIIELNRRLSTEKASEIFVNESDTIWVATETKGIFIADERLQKIYHLHRNSKTQQISDNHIASIYQSNDGIIWLGTWLSGVVQLKFSVSGIQTISRFRVQDQHQPIDVPSIRAIYQDAQQRWWIGTDSDGILTAEGLAGPYQQFNRNSGVNLPSDSIRTFYQLSSGELVIGTEDGVGYFDRESGYQVITNEQTQAAVLPIATERNINSKIALVASKGQQSTAVDAQLTETSVGNRIRSIYQDQYQRLWIGTYDKGLFFQTADKKNIFHVPLLGQGLIDKVSLLYSDDNNRLWIATDNAGLFVIELNELKIIEHFHTELRPRLRAPGNSIWSLYQSKNKDVWMGTYGHGLGRLNYQTKIFDYINVESGLPNDVIYAIISDNQDSLWMSTNRGLAQLNLTTNSIASYFKVHGLPHDEFNSGAYFKSINGLIYFGTLKGIVQVNPELLLKSQENYRAYIDDIIINGESIHNEIEYAHTDGYFFAPERIVIEGDFQKLQLSFATNEYRELSLNKFRFRLLGFESQWQEVESSNRNISYSNLSPGDYRLELQVKSTNGLWSPATTMVDLQVNPPWFASGWAYIGYVILIFSLVLGCLEIFNRYRKRNSEMLQRLHYMVEHRTQELKSKNEQLELLNSELQVANEKLEKVSMTDALTGLGNRRMLYQFLERDIGDVNRAYIGLNPSFDNLKEVQAHDLLIFLIDIDHFKDINDQYGHAIGDRLLIEISQILSKVSREGDLVIRYGGEEFLLLLRDTSRSEGDYIAQRLLDSFRSHKFKVNQEVNIMITCSVGFAPYPFSSYYPSQLLPEQVIQIADLCLYSAKASGRDCSVGLIGHYSEEEVTISEVMNAPERLVDNGLLEISSSIEKTSLVWQSKESS